MDEGAESMTIEGYLLSMRAAFLPEKARGRCATLQYTFTGRQQGVCHAVIEDGTIETALGAHPAPTAAVTCDYDLWLRILASEEDGLLAYQAGRYTVEGDFEALMDSDTWFARPRTR